MKCYCKKYIILIIFYSRLFNVKKVLLNISPLVSFVSKRKVKGDEFSLHLFVAGEI